MASIPSPAIRGRFREWLADLMMARTYDLCGIFGLKLWKFPCTALTIMMLAMAAAETDALPAPSRYSPSELTRHESKRTTQLVKRTEV
jgi:hypothetical protein